MSTSELDRVEAVSSFYAAGDPMDELLVDREVELIRKCCNTFGGALEIGCGNGYSTVKLLEMFPEMEALEPSVSNVEMMKSRVGRPLKCYSMLLEEFEPTSKYDNVFFLNVLEHVEDPVASLAKLSTLIRDDGLIYISVPNCMSLNRRAGYQMGLLPTYDQFAPKDYEVGHRRLYTVEMLRSHCAEAGLRIAALKGVYLKPLAERQMIELGEDAVKAFYSLGEDIPEYCANLFAVAAKLWY